MTGLIVLDSNRHYKCLVLLLYPLARICQLMIFLPDIQLWSFQLLFHKSKFNSNDIKDVWYSINDINQIICPNALYNLYIPYNMLVGDISVKGCSQDHIVVVLTISKYNWILTKNWAIVGMWVQYWWYWSNQNFQMPYTTSISFIIY